MKDIKDEDVDGNDDCSSLLVDSCSFVIDKEEEDEEELSSFVGRM